MEMMVISWHTHIRNLYSSPVRLEAFISTERGDTIASPLYFYLVLVRGTGLARSSLLL